ncbi:MAG TPA: Flp family type IVb pilin [Chloroflexota bacterium]|nr:Flp family type IVb pilin [Chloroflexota bacterium]
MDLIQRFVREEEGQNVVEYALVLTLIAVAAIAGLTLAGSNINNWWSAIGSYVGKLQGSIP